MVLFTSRSLLTWGNLQVPHLASPSGICSLSTLNNWFFTSLQRLYDDWICILRGQSGEVEGGYGSLMGKLHHLPLPWSPIPPLPFTNGISLHEQLQSLGDIQEPHQDIAYLLVCTGGTTEDRCYSVFLVLVNPNQARASTMEEAVETLSACPSSGTNWPYSLAWLYKGSSQYPSPRTNTWASYPKKGRGNLLLVDQPTWNLPTHFCQPTSYLSHRFEWAYWTCYNHSIRTTEQRYKHHH